MDDKLYIHKKCQASLELYFFFELWNVYQAINQIEVIDENDYYNLIYGVFFYFNARRSKSGGDLVTTSLEI